MFIYTSMPYAILVVDQSLDRSTVGMRVSERLAYEKKRLTASLQT